MLRVLHSDEPKKMIIEERCTRNHENKIVNLIFQIPVRFYKCINIFANISAVIVPIDAPKIPISLPP